MRISSLLFTALCLLLSPPGHALTISSNPGSGHFLELYTSQGCYSCPPAERWISELKSEQRLWQDLFPINFHVDYWDHLGWKDPFARAEFSERQRQYARLRHSKNVATPGFVINGKGWNGYFWGGKLPRKKTLSRYRFDAEVDEAEIVVRFLKGKSTRLRVHAAVLGFGIETAVPRGENAGKRLHHDFVVIGYERLDIASKDFDGPVRIPFPATVDVSHERRSIVVWLSERNDPSPLQVAAGWF